VALHWLGSREVLDHALKLTTWDDPRVRARAGFPEMLPQKGDGGEVMKAELGRR
jgi:hypothetical protein